MKTIRRVVTVKRIIFYSLVLVVAFLVFGRTVTPYGTQVLLTFTAAMPEESAVYHESLVTYGTFAHELVADTPLDVRSKLDQKSSLDLATSPEVTTERTLDEVIQSQAKSEAPMNLTDAYYSDLNAAAAANTYLGGTNQSVGLIVPTVFGKLPQGLHPAEFILMPNDEQKYNDYIHTISAATVDQPVTVTVLGTDGNQRDVVITEGRYIQLAQTELPQASPHRSFPPRLISQNESGDSAGLMTALAYVDGNSPGVLSDVPVFGTGSITTDGQVASVAGVAAKINAAADAGATFFLLPDGNMISEDDAATRETAAKRHVTLIPITTLAEAVAFLQQHKTTP